MADSARSVAVSAARDAGRALLGLYGRVSEIRYKGAVDLVTEADDLSEQRIVSAIADHFPEHTVLTEESGITRNAGGSSAYRWIIDPLDGTTNFAHAHPVFAVSIGLEVAGELQLGVVYAPALDELFVVERGSGAYLNGERIQVSQTTTLLRSMLATGFNYDRDLATRNLPHWENFLAITQAVRRDGSAALDLCYVAAGRYDGYWEMGLKPWDSAAGALMVTEAGGMVTDFSGQPYQIDSATCLASNGRVHGQMTEILEKGGAPGRTTDGNDR